MTTPIYYDDEPFKKGGTITPELNSHLKKLADKADHDAAMDRVMEQTANIVNAVIMDRHNRYVSANPYVETPDLTDEELDAMDAESAAQFSGYETPKWFQEVAPIKAPISQTVYSDNAAMFEVVDNHYGGVVLPSYTLPPAPAFYPNPVPNLPNSTIPILTTTTTVEPVKPETKDSNPKDAVGIKKIAFSTVPSTVIAEVAVGMTEGARKYGRHNYRAVGVRYSVYYDATLRHLMKWWEGEDIDPDSGLSHVTKAITSLVVLRDAMINNMVTDDRPPAIPAGFWEEVQKKVDEVFAKYPESVDPFTETNRK